jgi:hypothetical protein
MIFERYTFAPEGEQGESKEDEAHWKGLVVLLKLQCMMIYECLMIWGVPKNI